jgi:hypothetical protein
MTGLVKLMPTPHRFPSGSLLEWCVGIALLTAPIGACLALLLEFPLYVNAWDEETYLAWQGVDTEGLSLPGYRFAQGLVYAWHVVGLSPATFNAVMDLGVVIAIGGAWTSWQARLGLTRLECLSLTLLTLYGACLFNGANPVASYLFPYSTVAPIVSSREHYSMLFRTPNPELSIILLSAFLCVASRLSHQPFPRNMLIWLLLAVAAVVSFSHFLVPGILMACAFLMCRNLPISLPWRIALTLSAMLIIQAVLGFVLSAYWITVGQHEFYAASALQRGEVRPDSFLPHFSLASTVLATALLAEAILRTVKRGHWLGGPDAFPGQIAVVCLVASLSASNAGLFGGITFENRGWISYASTPFAVLGLCFFYIHVARRYSNRQEALRASLVTASLLSAVLAAPYYGKVFAVAVSYSLLAGDNGVGDLVADSPDQTVPENHSWGSLFAMIRAKQSVPIGSTQTTFPWFGKNAQLTERTCAALEQLEAGHFTVVITRSGEYDVQALKERIHELLKHRLAWQACTANMPQPDGPPLFLISR